jgi:ribosomal protein L6P/L9E
MSTSRRTRIRGYKRSRSGKEAHNWNNFRARTDRRLNRNFLGEKIVRRVTMQRGVDVETTKGVKDQIELSGNSLEAVSQSAADIQQICRVRNKDIRKFLDGLYVSERGNIVES